MDFFLLARYLHLVSIFLVVGTLFFEAVFVKDVMSKKDIQKISRIDGLYGFAAILVVGIGLWMWLGPIGKPSEFYSYNWIFHTKVGLFITVGLLSIYPTVFFIKNRKGEDDELVKVPSLVKNMIYLEVGILFLIPLLAVLMARGIGSFG